MSEVKNWRNINNWHWIDKDCSGWAKDYFKEELPKIKIDKGDGGVRVSITEVREVKGDVDLNQRKGKLITLYDIALKLRWEGTDEFGNAVTGTIDVPEIAHDTDPEDYVFNVRVDDESSKTETVEMVVRKDLTERLRAIFTRFGSALIEANKGDLIVEANKQRQGETPVAQSVAAAASGSSSATVKAFKKEQQRPAHLEKAVAEEPKSQVSTVSISKSTDLMASADDIYKSLTEADRVSVWTRAQASIEPSEGAEFSLFNGHITGRNVKLVPGKLIKQKWRVATWPAGHYSS
ncbi:Co-chaperone, partial [Spiromyces aspiralis]